MPNAHFSAATFTFLRELTKNNNREWFAKNKARYEAVAKEPMLRFMADIAAPLSKLAPQIVVDPRPVGGSMFRLYRDTRFAKDKAPYKTAVTAFFRHRGFGKGINAPGFYLHLGPDECFMGGGLYSPEGSQLQQVREAIVQQSRAWQRITNAQAFRERCTFHGASLSRPPRGFAPDHPLIEDLKRKNQVVLMQLDEAAVCAPDFVKTFVGNCKVAADMTGFLARAIGLPW